MSPLVIACIMFACVLIGTVIGMAVGRALPGHHLSGDSRDAVKQGLAMIATLAALVLGLLVATTKSSYDSQSAAVKELAANVVLVDRARKLAVIARQRGQSLAQLAVTWILRQPQITSVLIGASRPAQVEELYAGLSFPSLTDNEIAEIEKCLQ